MKFKIRGVNIEGDVIIQILDLRSYLSVISPEIKRWYALIKMTSHLVTAVMKPCCSNARMKPVMHCILPDPTVFRQYDLEELNHMFSRRPARTCREPRTRPAAKATISRVHDQLNTPSRPSFGSRPMILVPRVY